jgi:hypothetical protein
MLKKNKIYRIICEGCQRKVIYGASCVSDVKKKQKTTQTYKETHMQRDARKKERKLRCSFDNKNKKMAFYYLKCTTQIFLP